MQRCLWHASCVHGSGKREDRLVRREEVDEKERRRRRRRLCLLLSAACLHLMLPPSFFLCESRSSQRAVSGSQQHGGENIESMLLLAFESGVIVWRSDNGQSIGKRRKKKCTRRQSFHSTPPLHFPLTFAFFLSSSPFLFSLLTAVIVSFSLSKNIVFLPRCNGEKFSTCVLPFHLRGGERNLGGNQVS